MQALQTIPCNHHFRADLKTGLGCVPGLGERIAYWLFMVALTRPSGLSCARLCGASQRRTRLPATPAALCAAAFSSPAQRNPRAPRHHRRNRPLDPRHHDQRPRAAPSPPLRHHRQDRAPHRLRIHRAHGFGCDQITAPRRESLRGFVTSSKGAHPPVSRSHRAAIRQAGLFAPPDRVASTASRRLRPLNRLHW